MRERRRGPAGEVHTEVVTPTIQGRSPRQLFWMRFRQDKAALFGAGVIILLSCSRSSPA